MVPSLFEPLKFYCSPEFNHRSCDYDTNLQSKLPVTKGLSHQRLVLVSNHLVGHVSEFLAVVEPCFHHVPVIL